MVDTFVTCSIPVAASMRCVRGCADPVRGRDLDQLLAAGHGQPQARGVLEAAEHRLDATFGLLELGGDEATDVTPVTRMVPGRLSCSEGIRRFLTWQEPVHVTPGGQLARPGDVSVGAPVVGGAGRTCGGLARGGQWGRCHPQQPSQPPGQPPVPATEQADQGGDEQRPDHGGVDEDAHPERGADNPDVGPWGGGERGEGEEQDQRGGGHEPPDSPPTTALAVDPVLSHSSRIRAG
jgi:hypothetical protein